MNPDGTLTLVRNADSYSIWHSSLPGAQGSYFVTLGGDGNLLIRAGTPEEPGALVWLANGIFMPIFSIPYTFPGQDFYAIVAEDGNFTVRRGTGPDGQGGINDSGLIWQTGPDYNAVADQGPIMNNRSQNGLFSTRMSAGVLQVMGPQGAIWSAPSGGDPTAEPFLDHSGNFLVKIPWPSSAPPVWQTGIQSRGATSTRPFVLIENDGNLSVHDNWGELWSAQCGIPGGVPAPVPDPVQSLMDQFSAILAQAPEPFPDYTGAEKDAFDTINAALANYNLKLWHDLAGIQQGWVDALRQDKPGYATVIADIDAAIGDAAAIGTFFTNLTIVSEATAQWLFETVNEVSQRAVLDQDVVITLGGGEGETALSLMTMALGALPDPAPDIATAITIAQAIMTLGGNAAVQNNPALAAISATTVEMEGRITDAQGKLNEQLATYRDDLLGPDNLDRGKLRAAARLLAAANANWAQTIKQLFNQEKLMRTEVEIWQALLAAGFSIQNMQYYGPPGLPGNAFIDEGDYPGFQPNNVPAVGAWLDQLFPGTLQEPDDPQPRNGCWARFRALVSQGDGTWLGPEAVERLFVALAVPPEDVFNSKNGWCLTQSTYYGSYPYRLALQIQESSYWGPGPIPQ